MSAVLPRASNVRVGLPATQSTLTAPRGCFLGAGARFFAKIPTVQVTVTKMVFGQNGPLDDVVQSHSIGVPNSHGVLVSEFSRNLARRSVGTSTSGRAAAVAVELQSETDRWVECGLIFGDYGSAFARLDRPASPGVTAQWRELASACWRLAARGEHPLHRFPRQTPGLRSRRSCASVMRERTSTPEGTRSVAPLLAPSTAR